MTFSVENLCTLAAKTTCKDRWRQILNEADRLRDENKYLMMVEYESAKFTQKLINVQTPPASASLHYRARFLAVTHA